MNEEKTDTKTQPHWDQAGELGFLTEKPKGPKAQHVCCIEVNSSEVIAYNRIRRKGYNTEINKEMGLWSTGDQMDRSSYSQ